MEFCKFIISSRVNSACRAFVAPAFLSVFVILAGALPIRPRDTVQYPTVKHYAGLAHDRGHEWIYYFAAYVFELCQF